jgi:hypothetical protein
VGGEYITGWPKRPSRSLADHWAGIYTGSKDKNRWKKGQRVESCEPFQKREKHSSIRKVKDLEK